MMSRSGGGGAQRLVAAHPQYDCTFCCRLQTPEQLPAYKQLELMRVFKRRIKLFYMNMFVHYKDTIR